MPTSEDLAYLQEQIRHEVKRGLDDVFLRAWMCREWITTTRPGRLCMRTACIAILLLMPFTLPDPQSVNWRIAFGAVGVLSILYSERKKTPLAS
jgi:hypothetical protein